METRTDQSVTKPYNSYYKTVQQPFSESSTSRCFLESVFQYPDYGFGYFNSYEPFFYFFIPLLYGLPFLTLDFLVQ
jgi:hypothetical protein